jgi:hypothetical protein
MKTPAWYVFKDFFDLLSPKDRQHLMVFLTEDEKEDLENSPPLPFQPAHGICC